VFLIKAGSLYKAEYPGGDSWILLASLDTDSFTVLATNRLQFSDAVEQLWDFKVYLHELRGWKISAVSLEDLPLYIHARLFPPFERFLESL